ncbi:MAG: arsinothricin resistance N-acetyltransferase ArsN1 family B [Candidatus Binataceae bacterium]
MDSAIRLATEHDAACVSAIYAPYVRSTDISFELEAPTKEEMRLRILGTLAHLPWLVFEQGGQVLGYAYAGEHGARPGYAWSVDTSVYIDEGSRRTGIGRVLYTSLFRILKLQGFYNAYAGITLPNPASVGLHELMGFRPVGVYSKVGYKRGEWHDVGYWQLPLRECIAKPEEIVSLETVRKHTEWSSALSAGLHLLREG